LNYTHKGKIDVIYIDPPYNTGNKDFIYNDNYVDKEDSFRHSKWLSFMEKRLRLAKDLLKDTGVIFISIDDNEQAQLKLLSDSIFGFNNYISTISVVNNLKGRSDDKHIATANEFLLVYANNSNLLKIKGFSLDENQKEEYNKEDEYGLYKEIGFRKTGKGWRMEDRPKMYYPIYFNHSTKKISLDKFSDAIEIYPLTSEGEKGRWRWGKDTFLEKFLKDIVIREVKKNKYSVFTKMRIGDEDGEERTLIPKTFWLDTKYDTARGADILLDLFGSRDIFTNPKPLGFIKDILHISSYNNSIILDFTAGSGTTGHAVLELNKEDGGNRQFILCTNNENNICEEVTYERLKRVIRGYENKKGEKIKGLGGNLEYLKCDFIDKTRHTDNMKMRLMRACTEMLCLKENTFELEKEVKDGETLMYRIYSGIRVNEKGESKKHNMGIYYDLDDSCLDDMRSDLKHIEDSHKTAYIFSLRNVADFIEDYRKWKGINIEEVPQKILEIYETIYKRNIRK
jgi:adenine-specific DNA-methyltransferase